MMDLMGKRIKLKRESFGYLVKDLSAQIGVTSTYGALQLHLAAALRTSTLELISFRITLFY